MLKKIFKAVSAALAATLGVLAFMWVVIFGVGKFMNLIQEYTGSVFLGAFTPIALFIGAIAALIVISNFDE